MTVDKKDKDSPEVLPTANDTRVTLRSDHGKDYPLDIVRDAWVKSHQGTLSFARRYGLSEGELQEAIKAGNWALTREKYRERLYKIMQADRMELVEWRQVLLQRAEMYEMIAMETTLNDIHDQLDTIGDLFVRGLDGEIIRDACGNPFVRKITKEMKESLKLSEVLREGNAQVLDDARKTEQVAKGKAKTVNYDADAIFLERADDDSSEG